MDGVSLFVALFFQVCGVIIASFYSQRIYYGTDVAMEIPRDGTRPLSFVSDRVCDRITDWCVFRTRSLGVSLLMKRGELLVPS